MKKRVLLISVLSVLLVLAIIAFRNSRAEQNMIQQTPETAPVVAPLAPVSPVAPVTPAPVPEEKPEEKQAAENPAETEELKEEAPEAPDTTEADNAVPELHDAKVDENGGVSGLTEEGESLFYDPTDYDNYEYPEPAPDNTQETTNNNDSPDLSGLPQWLQNSYSGEGANTDTGEGDSTSDTVDETNWG